MARRYDVLKRSPASVWLRRAVAVAGTVAVLAVGGVSASMVLSGGEEEAAVPVAPVATPTPSPAPRKPRLTARQREERRRAVDMVRREGYAPVKLADYRADHVLRVLIGEPVGTTPAGRRAFFFARDRYLGTDAPTGSAKLRPGRQLEREITLVYTLYEPGDRECCPSGGEERVHFRVTSEAFGPREPVPDPAARLPP